MRTNLHKAVIVSFCSLLFFLTCKASEVPLKNAEVITGYNVFPFSPVYVDSTGWAHLGDSELNRVNQSGLNIKAAYITSDGVDHIILRGTVKKGIPLGLMYLDNYDYYGRGDFSGKIVNFVLPAPYDDDKLYAEYVRCYKGALGATPNGTLSLLSGTPMPSYEYIFDPKEFGTEYLIKGSYTAVTLSGLLNVEDPYEPITIIEINDSLNLYSSKFREDHYPDIRTFSQTDPLYRRTAPYNNPNNFLPQGAPGSEGQPRGGYTFLISEWADPKEAVFELAYPSGVKKTVIVDYSEVVFEPVPLKNDVAPPTLDAGLCIYNNVGTWTAWPPTPTEQIELLTGETTVYGTLPVPEALPETTKYRFWFDWKPFNSTCRIKEVNIINSDVEVEAEWDDEYGSLMIKLAAGVEDELAELELELILSEPYYYDSTPPVDGEDSLYVDTIVLTYP